MSVSHDDVRHVASLARVEIDDRQLQGLVVELNDILAHMEVLQSVNIERHDSSPMIERAPLRQDGDSPDILLRSREVFGPSVRDGFFLVPKLTTHGEHGTADQDGVVE